jgi:hypothetical protein
VRKEIKGRKRKRKEEKGGGEKLRKRGVALPWQV